MQGNKLPHTGKLGNAVTHTCCENKLCGAHKKILTRRSEIRVLPTKPQKEKGYPVRSNIGFAIPLRASALLSKAQKMGVEVRNIHIPANCRALRSGNEQARPKFHEGATSNNNRIPQTRTTSKQRQQPDSLLARNRQTASTSSRGSKETWFRVGAWDRYSVSPRGTEHKTNGPWKPINKRKDTTSSPETGKRPAPAR
jgi:hypothetical protein